MFQKSNMEDRIKCLFDIKKKKKLHIYFLILIQGPDQGSTPVLGCIRFGQVLRLQKHLCDIKNLIRERVSNEALPCIRKRDPINDNFHGNNILLHGKRLV